MKEIKDFDFSTKPNPDKQVYDEVTSAIADNENYCCCAIEKTEDTKCMCKDFREQQESGFCHCSRFYKVRDYPIITILCAPADNERAQVIAEDLTMQGFIVLIPMYRDLINYVANSYFYDEMQKVKIHKADLVLVLNTNKEVMEFMSEQIYWAQELKKKILYEHTEEVKDEN